MKSKINQILLLAAVLITVSMYIQSCKNDETVVTPPPIEPENPVPVLVSPHNESSSQILTPLLDWEDFSNAQSYRIQISLDANFEGIMILDSSGITASQLQIQQGRLSTNSFNYWRVNATGNSIGTTNWSKVWRFNVILEAPDPPVLISPPDGTTNLGYTPELDWSDVPGAQIYRVQVSPYQNFSAVILDSGNLTQTQITVPVFILNSNLTYYWRANAANSNGISTSQWTAPWSFTTISGPPPNTISGTIFFVDTNFIQGIVGYQLGIYTTWPPVGPPAISDTFSVIYTPAGYKANYRITHLLNGNYYVTVVTTSGLFQTPPVLGIYGCDTVHLQYSPCPANPTTVNIVNNIGKSGINFLSWADTLMRIY
ncbi:MAG: hypothetical protein EHM58_06830 [Ignavibacteriae bacterium]|nr:MAG: hypothetical protein EHM58_06830 [Ignavibacteriota bacterium]